MAIKSRDIRQDGNRIILQSANSEEIKNETKRSGRGERVYQHRKCRAVNTFNGYDVCKQLRNLDQNGGWDGNLGAQVEGEKGFEDPAPYKPCVEYAITVDAIGGDINYGANQFFTPKLHPNYDNSPTHSDVWTVTCQENQYFCEDDIAFLNAVKDLNKDPVTGAIKEMTLGAGVPYGWNHIGCQHWDDSRPLSHNGTLDDWTNDAVGGSSALRARAVSHPLFGYADPGTSPTGMDSPPGCDGSDGIECAGYACECTEGSCGGGNDGQFVKCWELRSWGCVGEEQYLDACPNPGDNSSRNPGDPAVLRSQSEINMFTSRNWHVPCNAEETYDESTCAFMEDTRKNNGVINQHGRKISKPSWAHGYQKPKNIKSIEERIDIHNNMNIWNPADINFYYGTEMYTYSTPTTTIKSSRIDSQNREIITISIGPLHEGANLIGLAYDPVDPWPLTPQYDNGICLDGIQSVIGTGTAALCGDNGWVGSLQAMHKGLGYWAISNIDWTWEFEVFATATYDFQYDISGDEYSSAKMMSFDMPGGVTISLNDPTSVFSELCDNGFIYGIIGEGVAALCEESGIWIGSGLNLQKHKGYWFTIPGMSSADILLFDQITNNGNLNATWGFPPPDGQPIIYGCTNDGACNYNPNATDDDGQCYFCAGETSCSSGEVCNTNHCRGVNGEYLWLGADNGGICLDVGSAGICQNGGGTTPFLGYNCGSDGACDSENLCCDPCPADEYCCGPGTCGEQGLVTCWDSSCVIALADCPANPGDAPECFGYSDADCGSGNECILCNNTMFDSGPICMTPNQIENACLDSSPLFLGWENYKETVSENEIMDNIDPGRGDKLQMGPEFHHIPGENHDYCHLVGSIIEEFGKLKTNLRSINLAFNCLTPYCESSANGCTSDNLEMFPPGIYDTTAPDGAGACVCEDGTDMSAYTTEATCEVVPCTDVVNDGVWEPEWLRGWSNVWWLDFSMNQLKGNGAFLPGRFWDNVGVTATGAWEYFRSQFIHQWIPGGYKSGECTICPEESSVHHSQKIDYYYNEKPGLGVVNFSNNGIRGNLSGLKQHLANGTMRRFNISDNLFEGNLDAERIFETAVLPSKLSCQTSMGEPGTYPWDECYTGAWHSRPASYTSEAPHADMSLFDISRNRFTGPILRDFCQFGMRFGFSHWESTSNTYPPDDFVINASCTRYGTVENIFSSGDISPSGFNPPEFLISQNKFCIQGCDARTATQWSHPELGSQLSSTYMNCELNPDWCTDTIERYGCCDPGATGCTVDPVILDCIENGGLGDFNLDSGYFDQTTQLGTTGFSIMPCELLYQTPPGELGLWQEGCNYPGTYCAGWDSENSSVASPSLDSCDFDGSNFGRCQCILNDGSDDVSVWTFMNATDCFGLTDEYQACTWAGGGDCGDQTRNMDCYLDCDGDAAWEAGPDQDWYNSEDFMPDGICSCADLNQGDSACDVMTNWAGDGLACVTGWDPQYGNPIGNNECWLIGCEANPASCFGEALGCTDPDACNYNNCWDAAADPPAAIPCTQTCEQGANNCTQCSYAAELECYQDLDEDEYWNNWCAQDSSGAAVSDGLGGFLPYCGSDGLIVCTCNDLGLGGHWYNSTSEKGIALKANGPELKGCCTTGYCSNNTDIVQATCESNGATWFGSCNYCAACASEEDGFECWDDVESDMWCEYERVIDCCESLEGADWIYETETTVKACPTLNCTSYWQGYWAECNTSECAMANRVGTNNEYQGGTCLPETTGCMDNGYCLDHRPTANELAGNSYLRFCGYTYVGATAPDMTTNNTAYGTTWLCTETTVNAAVAWDCGYNSDWPNLAEDASVVVCTPGDDCGVACNYDEYATMDAGLLNAGQSGEACLRDGFHLCYEDIDNDGQGEDPIGVYLNKCESSIDTCQEAPPSGLFYDTQQISTGCMDNGFCGAGGYVCTWSEDCEALYDGCTPGATYTSAEMGSAGTAACNYETGSDLDDGSCNYIYTTECYADLDGDNDFETVMNNVSLNPCEDFDSGAGPAGQTCSNNVTCYNLGAGSGVINCVATGQTGDAGCRYTDNDPGAVDGDPTWNTGGPCNTSALFDCDCPESGTEARCGDEGTWWGSDSSCCTWKAKRTCYYDATGDGSANDPIYNVLVNSCLGEECHNTTEAGTCNTAVSDINCYNDPAEGIPGCMDQGYCAAAHCWCEDETDMSSYTTLDTCEAGVCTDGVNNGEWIPGNCCYNDPCTTNSGSAVNGYAGIDGSIPWASPGCGTAGSCYTSTFSGSFASAVNFNADAEIDDGSCTYAVATECYFSDDDDDDAEASVTVTLDYCQVSNGSCTGAQTCEEASTEAVDYFTDLIDITAEAYWGCIDATACNNSITTATSECCADSNCDGTVGDGGADGAWNACCLYVRTVNCCYDSDGDGDHDYCVDFTMSECDWGTNPECSQITFSNSANSEWSACFDGVADGCIDPDPEAGECDYSTVTSDHVSFGCMDGEACNTDDQADCECTDPVNQWGPNQDGAACIPCKYEIRCCEDSQSNGLCDINATEEFQCNCVSVDCTDSCDQYWTYYQNATETEGCLDQVEACNYIGVAAHCWCEDETVMDGYTTLDTCEAGVCTDGENNGEWIPSTIPDIDDGSCTGPGPDCDGGTCPDWEDQNVCYDCDGACLASCTDCNGDCQGTAALDICGDCNGGGANCTAPGCKDTSSCGYQGEPYDSDCSSCNATMYATWLASGADSPGDIIQNCTDQAGVCVGVLCTAPTASIDNACEVSADCDTATYPDYSCCDHNGDGSAGGSIAPCLNCDGAICDQGDTTPGDVIICPETCANDCDLNPCHASVNPTCGASNEYPCGGELEPDCTTCCVDDNCGDCHGGDAACNTCVGGTDENETCCMDATACNYWDGAERDCSGDYEAEPRDDSCCQYPQEDGTTYATWCTCDDPDGGGGAYQDVCGVCDGTATGPGYPYASHPEAIRAITPEGMADQLWSYMAQDCGKVTLYYNEHDTTLDGGTGKVWYCADRDLTWIYFRVNGGVTVSSAAYPNTSHIGYGYPAAGVIPYYGCANDGCFSCTPGTIYNPSGDDCAICTNSVETQNLLNVASCGNARFCIQWNTFPPYSSYVVIGRPDSPSYAMSKQYIPKGCGMLMELSLSATTGGIDNHLSAFGLPEGSGTGSPYYYPLSGINANACESSGDGCDEINCQNAQDCDSNIYVDQVAAGYYPGFVGDAVNAIACADCATFDVITGNEQRQCDCDESSADAQVRQCDGTTYNACHAGWITTQGALNPFIDNMEDIRWLDRCGICGGDQIGSDACYDHTTGAWEDPCSCGGNGQEGPVPACSTVYP